MPTGPRINPQTDAVGLSGFAEIAAERFAVGNHLPSRVQVESVDSQGITSASGHRS